jgi:hypothetical protein
VGFIDVSSIRLCYAADDDVEIHDASAVDSLSAANRPAANKAVLRCSAGVNTFGAYPGGKPLHLINVYCLSDGPLCRPLVGGPASLFSGAPHPTCAETHPSWTKERDTSRASFSGHATAVNNPCKDSVITISVPL